jgi:uncharacterized sulfatase
LVADPDEINNLTGSPEHRDVLLRMRQAHAEWAERIKDVGLLSEWEMHARAHGTTPYEMGHDPQRYDFQAIFSAASLASSRAADDLPEVVKLLKQADSGVRYWGAIGLLAHQEVGVRAGHDELLAALADDSPIVQIMAAEALGRFGSEADAVAALEVLLQYIKPEANYFLAVAAWNVLDYLDERVLPALDKIKSLPTNWNRVPPRMGEYPTRLKQKMLADLQKPLGLPHGGFP